MANDPPVSSPKNLMPSATSITALLKDTALMLLTRGSNILLGLSNGIVIARALGPSGKGVLTIALLVPTFMQWFGPLGLNNSNIYLIGRYPDKIDHIIGNSVYASFVSFASCFGLFWLTYPLTRHHLLASVPPSILLLATIFGGLVLIWVFGNSVLLGQRRYMHFNFLQLLQSGSSLLLMVPFLWWFKMGVLGAAIAVAISGALVAAAALMLMMRGQRLPPPFDLLLIRQALKYGGGYFVTNATLGLLLRADMLLVGAWRSPAEVGFYSVAVTLAEVLRNFPEVLSFALFPRISSVGSAAAVDLTSRVSRTSIFVSLLVLCFVFPLCPYLIRWSFGNAFVASLIPSWILMVSMLSLVISYNMGSFLMGTGRVWSTAGATFTGLLVMLALDYVWIPPYGIIGASWASLLGYSSMAAIQTLSFMRLTGTRLSELLIMRRSDFHPWSSFSRA